MVVPATDNTATYSRGKVTKILDQQSFSQDEQTLYTQQVVVKKNDSSEVVTIAVGNEFQPLNSNQLLKVGTQVIISRQQIQPGVYEYVLVDVYRTLVMQWLAF